MEDPIMPDPSRNDGGGDSARPYLIYCAGVGWDAVQGTDHRLATALSDHLPVLWVDPPTSIVRGGWRSVLGTGRGRQMWRVADRIVRLSVTAPPYPERAAIRSLTDRIVERSIRSATRSLAGAPAAMLVTCYEPRFNALEGRLKVTRAYYATDDFVAGADLMGVSKRYLEGALQCQLDAADIVLTVSREMANRLAVNRTRPIVVLPNGCDPDHFDGVDGLDFPLDVHLRPPIVGLIGQISDRVDIRYLEAIVDSGVSLLLVGPINPAFESKRMARILGRPNVQNTGSVSFAELPKYMRAIDVGITPYTQSDFNRASFPLKALEYLSAGRGSIATPLPALQELSSGLIRFGSTPAEFAEAVARELKAHRTEAVSASRRLLARQNSWAERAKTLVTTLHLKV
jgi:teichuronic acid biosynthesis glycosyltransferase TuaH